MEVTALKPFSYQSRLRDYLKNRKKLWKWFSNKGAKDQFFDNWKKDLLKDSYRLDRSSHEDLYNMVDDILGKTALPISVVIYQRQMSYENNVGIGFHNKEAHVVISGRVLSMLSKDEIKAVLAHELFHYYLFSIEEESFEIADRIITSISNDSRSKDIYIESARLFKLYMELYCDRGAYLVMGDTAPVISSLVKLVTGVDKVNAVSYLSQAEEILSSERSSSEKTSHPETYIRAVALDLWANKNDRFTKKIEDYIEPRLNYEKLNVFSQEALDGITKNLIRVLIRPNWNRSPLVINLANEYSGKIKSTEEVNTETFFNEINELSDSTKKYLSYVLLDFALVDPSNEDAPLGYAFEIAENSGMKQQFKLTVKKELKLTERRLRDVQESAALSLNRMSESEEDSLYGE